MLWKFWVQSNFSYVAIDVATGKVVGAFGCTDNELSDQIGCCDMCSMICLMLEAICFKSHLAPFGNVMDVLNKELKEEIKGL